VRVVASPAAPPREPPVYRPLGLLAFAAAILGGTPIGFRLLAWLYLGASAPGPEWRLLHAHVQVFGFFATLIPGVAQHLMPRFTGQPVVRRRIVPLLTAAFGIALVLRAAGTASESPAALVVAAALQAAGFLAFAWQVWRTLDPPPLALLRWQLTGATLAFALAMGAETVARWQALAAGLAVPSDAPMRAVHAVGLYAVLGWVLGVLLRAGPMFVPGWAVAPSLARGVALALALAAAVAVAAEAGDWANASTGLALARAGDALALAAVVAVALGAGALRQARATLPVIGRSGPESRIFRVGVVCAVVAFVGCLATAVLAASGVPDHLLTDAVRHLVTVGFVTAVVVAMAFRLIPVLEGVALPWPWLRTVALASLIAAVVARTAQVPIAYLAPSLAPVVALSGVLVWIALVSVGANLVAAIARRPAR
jgi:hypothetical protein